MRGSWADVAWGAAGGPAGGASSTSISSGDCVRGAASSSSSATVAGFGVLTGILLATLEPFLIAVELLLDVVFDSDLPGDERPRTLGSNAHDASWKCFAHSSGEYLAGGGGGDGTADSWAASLLFCCDVSWKVLALGCCRKALELLREGVADLRPVVVVWAAAKTLLLVKSPAHCDGTKDVLILSSLRLLAMLGLKVSALMGIVNLVEKRSAFRLNCNDCKINTGR